MKTCERCGHGRAEFVLETRTRDRNTREEPHEQVCGRCVPPGATRISAFTFVIEEEASHDNP